MRTVRKNQFSKRDARKVSVSIHKPSKVVRIQIRMINGLETKTIFLSPLGAAISNTILGITRRV
jgi:hypothetical protein